MSKTIRTPEDRFKNLPGYDFSPNYLEVGDGLRMHYVDEGAKDTPVVLLLHGEPSWSYLYRKMIPVLVAGGFRVLAPDFIGFGKSDKLTEKTAYTYQTHIDWTTDFLQQLDLQNIHLFCQDWGGLIGFRLVTEMPDRFAKIVASNTMLPTGQHRVSDAFKSWLEFSKNSPAFDIGRVIQMGTATDLPDDVVAAYNAPFPSEEYKACARIFPSLVPITEDDPEGIKNREAWKILAQWEKPFLTIFGELDMVTKGGERVFQKLVPGTKGQAHTTLKAGHFIQEDVGEELAGLLVEFFGT